jgi:enoyl-CoA hydratase/carnithine racemase
MPLSFIDWHLDDGVATLTLDRPRAGNALNWAMLEQLRTAVRRAAGDPIVRAIVIAAAGGRFVSGADVGFFVRALESGEMERIVECIRCSQEVFAEIAASPKPVVAAVQGAAVGGGVELALACHQIIATPRASFSFPETALGILPFSGGTYRAPRRIGVELTKWLVYTGHVLPPPKAVALGLADQLAMPDELAAAAKARAIALCERPAAATQAAPSAEFDALRTLFAGARLSELRAAAPPADRAVAAALKAVAGRPLLALEWGERLIDAAPAQSVDEAAAAALAAVPILFAEPQVHALMARAAAEQQRAH